MRLGLGTDISVGYRQPLFGGVPFLLDTYTGAAAAYSLRQLRTGVTNVVRVREDVGNTEQDFTAEEITDGTLLAFVGAGNNGHVVTWYDQSGNGNDATQSTATNQPKIVDSGVLVEENGKPALDFDGVDDFIETSDYIVEMSQNPVSIYIVKSSLNGLKDGYLMVEGDNVSPYSSQFIIGDSGTNPSIIWVNTTLIGSMNDGQGLVGVEYDGNVTVDAYINGAFSGTGTVTINTETSLVTGIGGLLETPNKYEGKLQEIITYKSDQSANRTAIEQNINDHYSIYP